MYIVKKPKGELVQKDFFMALPFWSDLGRDEQAAIETETRGLVVEMTAQVVSRLRMGEHLLTLQTVLKDQISPATLTTGRLHRGRFLVFLKTLRFSYRTAYRYMELVKIIRNGGGGGLSETVLQMAAARGIDLVGHTPERPFGPYTEPIKKLGPAPKDTAKVPEWIEAVEAERQALPRRGRKRAPVPPEDRMVRAFRAAVSEYKGLNGGRRSQWASRLVGMLMAEFGLPKGSVAPEAVPEGFRAVLGRPKMKEGAVA